LAQEGVAQDPMYVWMQLAVQILTENFNPANLMWLGSLAVACRTSDREVAGSTPGRSTAR